MCLNHFTVFLIFFTIFNFRCTCNNCVAMPTATERRCCQSFAVCQPKLDEATITCITMHEAFQVNCLNHHVLELSFYEYLDYNGPIGGEEPVHELYRYIAYRRYTRWLWHRLGKKTRKVIPSCVVSAIRTRFPSDEYTGFRYPRDYWVRIHRKRPRKKKCDVSMDLFCSEQY